MASSASIVVTVDLDMDQPVPSSQNHGRCQPENALRHVIREYLDHYHAERNHQGLENVIRFPDSRLAVQRGLVVKAERLSVAVQNGISDLL